MTTMLSGLIKELQEYLDTYGDQPVVAKGPYGYVTSKIEIADLPHSYDGGWLDPAEDTPYHCRHWSRSKTSQAYPHAVEISSDNPAQYLSELYCNTHGHSALYTSPEDRDTIDGEPVRDVGGKQ